MHKETLVLLAATLAFASGSIEFIKTKDQMERAEYPENITNLETLKEFVRIVDQYKLNVSLIMSSGKNWEDGNMKEATAMTITFPVNEASITEGTLEREAFMKLLKAANKEKLTVAATLASNNKLSVITNNKKGLPITKAYKIFTGIKNGKTGFVFDDENYVAQYTFMVSGNDGKNETTKVLWGDAKVEVVDKSDAVSDDDVKMMKKVFLDTFMTTNSDVLPKALVVKLHKMFPNRSWETAMEVGDDSYVDSEYRLTMRFLDENFLIYTT